MKLLLFTDNHFCETSSILQKLGQKYSIRLENQVSSLNWLENLAVEKDCSAVVCLGDFFDKPTLTDNELTALKDISWNKLPHYFLVGNHESEEADLCFSSTKALETENHYVISEPSIVELDDCVLKFLPYITERNRKQIGEYFNTKASTKKQVILSHNDLKGIQMGPVETVTGFEIPDIKQNCNLFVNGHLHNGTKITDGVINLGNLTGQDFKEDAFKYAHNIMILDTATLKYELIENPYAFKFYSIEIKTEADLAKIKALHGQNLVVAIKCIDTYSSQAYELLNNNYDIVASRFTTIKSLVTTDSAESDIALGKATDCFAELISFSKEKLENTPVLDYELAEICK